MATKPSKPQDSSQDSDRSFIIKQVFIKKTALDVTLAPFELTAPWQPDASMQIDVHTENLANDDYIVELKTNIDVKNDNKQIFTIESIQSGIFQITGYTDEYLFDGEFILTPRNGTIGVFTYTQGKIFPSDHVFVIDVNSETNKKYIYRILENFGTKLNKMKTGMGIPNITKKKLYEFKIPIPSQEIQQQCIVLFEEKEKFIKSIDDKINSEKAYIVELKQMAKDVISSFC